MSIVHLLEADHPANFACAQAGCRECLEQLMGQHERLRDAGQVEGWRAAMRMPDGLSALVSAWEASELEQALREGLNGLPERRRQVIVLAYGLEGERPHSLAEIGRLWGVSRERVREVRN